MKLIPLVIVFSVAYFCGTIREKMQPALSPPVNQTSEPTRPASNELPLHLPTPRTVSGGNLNEKAKSLPQPIYPPAARAVRAAGAVSVQVLVDETGKVVSASAVSGHPLLHSAAEQAARKAKFEPYILSGQAKKVVGTLTYTFQP